ncbi:hypothetical protein PENTCL1PPCAC_12071, partial [Pristionchus entomophagus]
SSFAPTVPLPHHNESFHTGHPTLLRTPNGTLCVVCAGARCNSVEWVRIELIYLLDLASEKVEAVQKATVATPPPPHATTTLPGQAANATVAELEGEPIGNKFVVLIIATMATVILVFTCVRQCCKYCGERAWAEQREHLLSIPAEEERTADDTSFRSRSTLS